MRRTHTYHVKYRLIGTDTKGIDVIAMNVIEAYDKAVYELIPDKEGEMPYSAWVASITYQNGNYKILNNFEGKPY